MGWRLRSWNSEEMLRMEYDLPTSIYIGSLGLIPFLRYLLVTHPRHEHTWGRPVTGDDGSEVKRCTECGMEVEELEF